jgi:hypothetical protein
VFAPGFFVFEIHCSDMANTAKTVKIPLTPAEAIRLLGKVKPTADMPRQGAHSQTAKKKTRKK